jgi:hypothetical protein
MPGQKGPLPTAPENQEDQSPRPADRLSDLWGGGVFGASTGLDHRAAIGFNSGVGVLDGGRASSAGYVGFDARDGECGGVDWCVLAPTRLAGRDPLAIRVSLHVASDDLA